MWEKDIEGIIIKEFTREKYDLDENLLLEEQFEKISSLVSKESISSVEKRLISKLLQDPEKLSGYFDYLIKKFKSDESLLIASVMNSIKIIGEIISYEFPDMASSYFRNIAESIQTFPEILLSLTLERIVTDEGLSIIGINIFNQFSVPEMASILAIFMKNKPGLIKNGLQFLVQLDLTKNAIFETVNLIKGKLKDSNIDRKEIENFILQKKDSSHSVSKFNPDTLKAFLHEPTDKVNPQELNQLIKEENSTLYIIQTLIEIILLESKEESLEKVFSLIDDILSSLLTAKKFHLALGLIKHLESSLKEKFADSVYLKKRVAHTFSKVSSEETVNSALNILFLSEKGSTEHQEALSILSFLE
ncbi:MAG: hypothetical protein KAS39_02780, partial [Actinomycetia bacterium]|nr:hypothetical protein [Actinomycetes bacterium]